MGAAMAQLLWALWARRGGLLGYSPRVLPGEGDRGGELTAGAAAAGQGSVRVVRRAGGRERHGRQT
eukprot:3491324-Prymnesium_polylepis.1